MDVELESPLWVHDDGLRVLNAMSRRSAVRVVPEIIYRLSFLYYIVMMRV